MRQWIEAYPPEGLNTTVEAIEALIKDEPELLIQFRGEVNGQLAKQGRPKAESEHIKGSGRTFNRGESSSYLTARLQRDAPEKLEQIGPGKKYRTITEAAIAAGIAKRRIRMEIKPDPADTAKILMQKCDRAYLLELTAILSESIESVRTGSSNLGSLAERHLFCSFPPLSRLKDRV